MWVRLTQVEASRIGHPLEAVLGGHVLEEENKTMGEGGSRKLRYGVTYGR